MRRRLVVEQLDGASKGGPRPGAGLRHSQLLQLCGRGGSVLPAHCPRLTVPRESGETYYLCRVS